VDDLFQSVIINNKCVLLYTPQPIRKVSIIDRRKVILGFVASSHADFYRKGGDIVIETYCQVKKIYDNVELHYIGQLPRWMKSKDLIELKIIHTNYIPHKKIISEYLPGIDVLLFPSRADTFGTIVLEAMSIGKAVVSSSGRHVFGLREILEHNHNAIVVDWPEDSAPVHANTINVNIHDFILGTVEVVKNFEKRKHIGLNAMDLFKSKLSLVSANKILQETYYRIFS
jgi:glycosyltransferase involved in cell wall biosynthesis